MKCIEEINRILDKKKELENCDNMIFEKENDILSCIKAIGEEGVRMRQKNAALSLLELKKNKENLQNELNELCKGMDSYSFKNKKMSSSMVAQCISEGVCKEDLNSLKNIFKEL